MLVFLYIELVKQLFQRFPPLQGTEFWKRKLRTAFRHYDTDKDGVLTAKDFELQAELLAKYNNMPGIDEKIFAREYMYMRIVSSGSECFTMG